MAVFKTKIALFSFYPLSSGPPSLVLVPYEHPSKLKFGLFNPATAYNSHFHMIDSLKDSCTETSSSCLTVIKERIVFNFFKDSQKTKDHHKTFQS